MVEHKLPPASFKFITGCCVNTIPGAAVDAGCVAKIIEATGPTPILNAFESTDVTPDELAVNTYAVPARSIMRPENVATPATAATLAVPDNVPDGLPTLIASAQVAVDDVTVFPYASCTSTTGWVGNAKPPVGEPPGCVEYDSLVALPNVMVNVDAVETAVYTGEDVA